MRDGKFSADRYELEKDKFNFIKTYTYDFERPNLITEIDKKIKENRNGLILGNVSYLRNIINLTNKPSKNNVPITTKNLKWCLLSYGINFNTHDKYFERSYITYRGITEQIPNELFSDAIIFALFFKALAFTNKGQKNYIMPFTADELGCNKNDLNVLYPQDKKETDLFSALENKPERPFDFRKFMSEFEFSKEAKELYFAALEIFKFYHRSEIYENKDFNDSFYDITNAIMGKDTSEFKTLDKENDTRITKVKTTKGTKGFGRKTIKYAVVNSADLSIFERFFDARDILAKKINKQLVDSGLLLWERENIY